MRSLILLASLLFLAACTKEVTNYVQEANGGAEAAKSAPVYSIQTGDATAEQCAAGGKVYEVLQDEVIVSTQIVCNSESAPVSAYAPAEVIVPCANTGSFSEVLLRLHNGQVLVSFSNNTQGEMTRLTLLPDGAYMTTDNTGCVFTLSTEGSTRSISWGGEVRSFWGLL